MPAAAVPGAACRASDSVRLGDMMDELETNRRRFMGGIAAGTVGLGVDSPPFWADHRDFPETPRRGSPPDGIFLAIEGPVIEGSATRRSHPGEIDVLSWHWGMSRPVSGGTGRGSGRPEFDRLFAGKEVDKATPQLMSSFANGTTHSRAVLSLVTGPSAGDIDVLTVTMEGVRIVSLSDFGTTEFWPVEHLALAFEAVAVEFAEVGQRGAIERTWSFESEIA